MEYETIPRCLYLKMVEDGIRVDRVRKVIEQANSAMTVKRMIYLIKKALMDTDTERLKLAQRNELIRQAEAEYR